MHLDVKTLLPAALACLATLPCGAADLSTDAWMTDRYDVEIIVFRHVDQARNTPEQPAADSIIRTSPLDLFAGQGIDP